MSFRVGKSIKWDVSTYDINDALFTPALITLTVVKGNGLSASPSLSELSTGVYRATVLPALGESGPWTWTLVYTDAAGNQDTVVGSFAVFP